MASGNITPPTVSKSINYTTGKDGNGIPLVYARNVTGFPADSAVEVGDAVSTVAPTATQPVSVEPAASGTQALVVGVALNGAAAGDIVQVADIGYVRSVGATAGQGVPLNTGGVCAASATFDADAHPFVALEDDITSFYSAVAATLVRFVR